MQPRVRLEDLVREFGISAGLVRLRSNQSQPESRNNSPSLLSWKKLSSTSPSSLSVATAHLRDNVYAAKVHPNALFFESLSVNFSPRKVGLVLTSQGQKRVVVEVSRDRAETLERCATRLIYELKGWADRSLHSS